MLQDHQILVDMHYEETQSCSTSTVILTATPIGEPLSSNPNMFQHISTNVQGRF